MTHKIEIEVHDTPPEGVSGDIVAYGKRSTWWGTCEARFVLMHWGRIFTHWHLPIDVTTMNKEQT